MIPSDAEKLSVLREKKEEHRKEMREKQFPLDLEKAFQMGTRLGMVK